MLYSSAQGINNITVAPMLSRGHCTAEEPFSIIMFDLFPTLIFLSYPLWLAISTILYSYKRKSTFVLTSSNHTLSVILIS